MKNNNMVMTVIIVIVVGAAAFFGGMKYQQSQASSNANGQFAQGGQNRQGGQGRFGGGANGAGRPVVGKIVSQDANSITIQLTDGSSKIVNIAGSTTISKTDTATKADLATGQTVAAFGTSNSDGSITAQNVQLNPMFRIGRGGGGGLGGRPTGSQ